MQKILHLWSPPSREDSNGFTIVYFLNLLAGEGSKNTRQMTRSVTVIAIVDLESVVQVVLKGRFFFFVYGTIPFPTTINLNVCEWSLAGSSNSWRALSTVTISLVRYCYSPTACLWLKSTSLSTLKLDSYFSYSWSPKALQPQFILTYHVVHRSTFHNVTRSSFWYHCPNHWYRTWKQRHKSSQGTCSGLSFLPPDL